MTKTILITVGKRKNQQLYLTDLTEHAFSDRTIYEQQNFMFEGQNRVIRIFVEHNAPDDINVTLSLPDGKGGINVRGGINLKAKFI